MHLSSLWWRPVTSPISMVTACMLHLLSLYGDCLLHPYHYGDVVLHLRINTVTALLQWPSKKWTNVLKLKECIYCFQLYVAFAVYWNQFLAKYICVPKNVLIITPSFNAQWLIYRPSHNLNCKNNNALNLSFTNFFSPMLMLK